MNKEEIEKYVREMAFGLTDTEKMKKLLDLEKEVFADRNGPDSYGAAYKESGLAGIIVVLRNKLNRITHFNPDMSGVEIDTTDIIDTLVDMSIYCNMGLICVREQVIGNKFSYADKEGKFSPKMAHCPKCDMPIDLDEVEPMCDKCGWAQ